MESKQLCEICGGEGWVCENHPNVGWNGGEAGCCGGAGSPCKCNTSNPPWSHITPWDEITVN